MSAATRQAIDDAIVAHLNDEQGAMTIGWVLLAKGKTIENLDEGLTRYVAEYSNHLEYDSVLGLAHYLVLMTERDFGEADPDE
jgi:hypothetical protein